MQTLDLADLALDSATQKNIALWRQRFDGLAGRLPHPREKVRGMAQAFTALDAKAPHENRNFIKTSIGSSSRQMPWVAFWVSH